MGKIRLLNLPSQASIFNSGELELLVLRRYCPYLLITYNVFSKWEYLHISSIYMHEYE